MSGDYGTTDRGLFSQGSGSSEKPKQEKMKIDKGTFEQLAHLGALGATAIAKYEGDQATKKAGTDAAAAEKHRKQEKLANSVAQGLGGFASQSTQGTQQPGHEASQTSTANQTPNPTSQHNTSQHTSEPTSQGTPSSNHSSKPSSGSPQDYFDKFEEGKKLLQGFGFLNKK